MRGRAGAGAGALLAILSLILAACGTTVAGVSDGAGPADPGAAPATGELSAPGVPGAPAPAMIARGPGQAVAAPGGSPTAATPQVTVAPTDATAPGVQGVGVTPTKIFIGVTYTSNGDVANAALGASGVTHGDERADVKAVIADINAHGGMAGRKVVPVYYAYDANSTAPYANQDQAACAKFTEDNHVFAVIGAGYTDDFTNCVNRGGALHIDQGEIVYPDQTFFAQHPYYFNIGTLSQDRMMAAEVAALVRGQYLGGWNASLGRPGTTTKVGILSFDVPEWNRPLESTMLPALARAGASVDSHDIYRVANPSGTADNGQIAAQIQSAVLRFRQDGVSHVIILDTTGGITLFFSSSARGQHYYPRIGINSATAVQILADEGLVDNAQLAGAVGLGWNPSLDLTAKEGDRYATSATEHCLRVNKRRTGQTYDSTNAASLALGYCDELYVLRDALAHTGPALNQETGRLALESIGNGYVPAALPAFFLSASRHDAAVLGYDMRWSTSCRCTQYVGKAHVIP